MASGIFEYILVLCMNVHNISLFFLNYENISTSENKYTITFNYLLVNPNSGNWENYWNSKHNNFRPKCSIWRNIPAFTAAFIGDLLRVKELFDKSQFDILILC